MPGVAQKAADSYVGCGIERDDNMTTPHGKLELYLARWCPPCRESEHLLAAGIKDTETDEYVPIPYAQGVALLKHWQLRFKSYLSVGYVKQTTYEIGEISLSGFFAEAGHILSGRL